MGLKDILTIAGIAVSILAALPYIRNILAHKTQPHIVTWFIWTILAAAGCIIQLIGNGGWGAGVLGVTAVLNLIIVGLSLPNAKDHITRFDLLILTLAAISFCLWRITSNPHTAAILLTFTMGMGYIPTYRKSISAPELETPSLYFLSSIKQLLGIGALSAYNLLTLLFPIFLVFANFGLVALLVVRRKQLSVHPYQS